MSCCENAVYECLKMTGLLVTGHFGAQIRLFFNEIEDFTSLA